MQQTCSDQTHREASLAAPMPVAVFHSSLFAHKRLHGIAPCGGLFAQSAAPSPCILYIPCTDQPSPASPGCIGYASFERGQCRPRSLMDQAVANG